MIRKIVTESDLPELLKRETEKQTKKNIFVNIKVSLYKGQKHPTEKENLYTVTIG